MTSVVTQPAELAYHAPEPAIVLTELCFAYPDRPPVLKNLSLQVAVGQRVGIIGHNGCGKTTLFMTLCGAYTPSSGLVQLFGESVVPGQFRHPIGLLFQDLLRPNYQCLPVLHPRETLFQYL
ncbi:MAG: energy-coupling factor ABC transporter ATP-binding protein, partial [Cyanobacteria bacterium J06632_22]